MQFSGSKIQVPFVFQCCVSMKRGHRPRWSGNTPFLPFLGMLYVGFPKLVSDLPGPFPLNVIWTKGLGVVGEEDIMIKLASEIWDIYLMKYGSVLTSEKICSYSKVCFGSSESFPSQAHPRSPFLSRPWTSILWAMFRWARALVLLVHWVFKGFLCPLTTLRIWIIHTLRGFPGGTSGKEPTFKAGDTRDAGSNPGSGRSPGGGHGNPVQYSCLENSMDRGAWWATVHGSHMRVRVGHDWSDLTWMDPLRVLVFPFKLCRE